jgi:hypothetical protein
MICRLDFVQFKIGEPSTQDVTFGQCLEDQFVVTSNAGTATPVICGTNTGQHSKSKNKRKKRRKKKEPSVIRNSENVSNERFLVENKELHICWA